MFALLVGRHAYCLGCEFRQAFHLGHFLVPFECSPSMEMEGGMGSFGLQLGHFLEHNECYPSLELDGWMRCFGFLPLFLLLFLEHSPVGKVWIG